MYLLWISCLLWLAPNCCAQDCATHDGDAVPHYNDINIEESIHNPTGSTIKCYWKISLDCSTFIIVQVSQLDLEGNDKFRIYSSESFDPLKIFTALDPSKLPDVTSETGYMKLELEISPGSTASFRAKTESDSPLTEKSSGYCGPRNCFTDQKATITWPPYSQVGEFNGVECFYLLKPKDKAVKVIVIKADLSSENTDLVVYDGSKLRAADQIHSIKNDVTGTVDNIPASTTADGMLLYFRTDSTEVDFEVEYTSTEFSSNETVIIATVVVAVVVLLLGVAGICYNRKKKRKLRKEDEKVRDLKLQKEKAAREKLHLEAEEQRRKEHLEQQQINTEMVQGQQQPVHPGGQSQQASMMDNVAQQPPEYDNDRPPAYTF